MKISLEWLSEYLPGPLDAKNLAEVLTHAGLPVEVIEPFGDDTVIDVEVTSNRSDCLSYQGIARELAALLNRELKEFRPAVRENGPLCSSATQVDIEALDLCPHYTARVIKNVKVGPSPLWMQRRLQAMGLRPINNLVDVTNYVMFEMGQPLHVFDYDMLGGHRIVVRQARHGESIVSLDGHERKLQQDMLVIADTSLPVALAGVMGGKETEVSDRTVNILLESARFDPLSIRKTARALAMKSDSSYRFERRIDPTLPLRASLRAAQLILETSGGELLAGVVEAGASGYEPKQLTVRLPRMSKVLGIELPVQEVMDAYTRLGFAPVLKGEVIECTVPSVRLDINIEEDLIEEAIRVIGYGRVPLRDEIAIRVMPPELDAKATNLVRETMIAGGYFESLTFTWVSDNLAGAFKPAEAASLLRADTRIRKADAHLRPSILPGLLESAFRNQSVGNGQVKLFETGSTFWYNAAGKVVERRRLALVGSDDEHEVRGVVEQVLAKLDKTLAVQVELKDAPGFEKGLAGAVLWGSMRVGTIGRIDPAICERLSLRSRPFAAELELTTLVEHCQHVPQLVHLPRFPAVRRDLSLVVAESVRYEQIEKLVMQLKLDDLEGVEYVTTYRGKPLEKGQKSVTLTLVFRSLTATLTAEQVEGSVQKAAEAAKTQLAATFRA
jgi:phenylalanyl-tRNA synthetase beta chain